jgi:hypothetical protein
MIAGAVHGPWPRIVLTSVLLVTLAGCEDTLGIGGACASEMQQIRRQHGPPDQQARGLRSEIWLYGSSSGGFYYEFSWSTAGEPCRVVGPVAQNRLPEAEVIFTISPTPSDDSAERRTISAQER